MKLAVIGTGYVGLVTGTCFAEMNNEVTCIDIDAKKVAKLQKGELPIYEPHLDKIFEKNLREGRLKFTTSLREGIEGAGVILLALPTPPGEDGSADLSYVLDVAVSIATLISDYVIIVDKSTVPVGTADKVRDIIASKTSVKFDIVSNPEFLREGFAVDDFMKPDRVVIGTESDKAKEVMSSLYAPFVRQGNPIIFMDERSAEMTKYAANAFLATKISFMNEVANLCERVDADVEKVRLGIGTDERIGKRFLFPGIGYGGSCFPKDVKALNYTAKEEGYEFEILDAVMKVNTKQRQLFLRKVKKYFSEDLKDRHFALWGLSFKPDTDDIREAPAINIIEDLISSGATVSVYDPEAMDNVKKHFSDKEGVLYAKNEYAALKGAEALLIATEWPLFRSPDFVKMKSRLKNPVVFDGRNIYDPEDMKANGFYYESIGRRVVDE